MSMRRQIVQGRFLILAMLLAGSTAASTGCSTVKWMYSDRATGEIWWIRERAFQSDEITYCTGAGAEPPKCRSAEMRDGPPPPILR